MHEEDASPMDLARRVRDALVKTMLAAHDEAGMLGLCGEGRLDYAIDQARDLDLSVVVKQWQASQDT